MSTNQAYHFNSFEGLSSRVSLPVQYIYSTSVKGTSKSHTLYIRQYLVHSERRTADTSKLIFMA